MKVHLSMQNYMNQYEETQQPMHVMPWGLICSLKKYLVTSNRDLCYNCNNVALQNNIAIRVQLYQEKKKKKAQNKNQNMLNINAK